MRFAIVYREGPQHPACRGEHRRRPARSQPVRQGQIAEIGPQRIRRDVGDDDLLCTVSGRPARSHGGADDDAIDCLSVAYWQAGRSAVPKAAAVRIQQEDRRQRTGGQFFDQAAYGLEDESASITPRYHLEKPFLSGKQRLGPLALKAVWPNPWIYLTAPLGSTILNSMA